ncbi:MAG: antibiotic biosynthesis monooxygenase [Microbacteriaceae bacterium]|nr:antibiotic biosynthesis monooxygenase [Microbacteriaceae bacterium]MCL2794286.1 antibiotic biosynthesis monooxygenase [Microbacteriaceae bacterium]
MTVTTLLELTIKPESLADAEAIITETLVATRAFAGNQGVTVAADVADPLHYVLVQTWDSLEADDAYRAWRATPEGASKLGSVTSGRVLTRYRNTTA